MQSESLKTKHDVTWHFVCLEMIHAAVVVGFSIIPLTLAGRRVPHHRLRGGLLWPTLFFFSPLPSFFLREEILLEVAQIVIKKPQKPLLHQTVSW